jgi:hypothetical protein
MNRRPRVRPLVVLALLAFAVIASFAGLILVPIWIQPPLSRASLGGWRARRNA